MSNAEQINLFDYFDYCPSSGKVVYNYHTPSGKRGPKVFPGKIATVKTSHGYLIVRINKKCFMAHNVAWELHNKSKVPFGMEVDHINRIRDDNRIENLRIVTRSGNNHNRSRFKTNVSGVVGVSWNKSKGKWHSRIEINGKINFLGDFDEYGEAVKARMEAERRLL